VASDVRWLLPGRCVFTWKEQSMPGSNDDPASLSDTKAHVPEEAFQRTATMIAAGELKFPEQLEAHQAAMLAKEVRRLRRRRLVQFIADSIAADIADSSSRNGVPNHD